MHHYAFSDFMYRQSLHMHVTCTCTHACTCRWSSTSCPSFPGWGAKDCCQSAGGATGPQPAVHRKAKGITLIAPPLDSPSFYACNRGPGDKPTIILVCKIFVLEISHINIFVNIKHAPYIHYILQYFRIKTFCHFVCKTKNILTTKQFICKINYSKYCDFGD